MGHRSLPPTTPPGPSPSAAPDTRHGPSPKPRGCPPMRTILHSSPEELVSSRSLGNLGQQEGGGRGYRDPPLPAVSPGGGQPADLSVGRSSCPLPGAGRGPVCHLGSGVTYFFCVSASMTMEM